MTIFLFKGIQLEDVPSKVTVDPPSVTSTPSDSAQSTPKLDRHDHENIYGNAGLMPAIKVAGLGKYIQTKKNQTDAFKEEFKVWYDVNSQSK